MRVSPPMTCGGSPHADRAERVATSAMTTSRILFPGSGKIVSRYDATFASDDPYPETPVPRGPDPILDGVIRGYGGAFVGYARDELGFKTDMTYNLLASEVTAHWDWDGNGRSPPSVADDLRVLLALTPSFRLLVAHGYSDTVTPYSDSRYVLQHLPQASGQEGPGAERARAFKSVRN